MAALLDRELVTDRMLAVCRRMYDRGLIIAREGNVSCRIGPDRILITPAGRGKAFLRAHDLVVVDRAGRQRGGRLAPSSELPMHLAVYEEQPSAVAVVHGHPPTATGFAVAGIPLADCVLPEIVAGIGSVPIASYGTPSTHELADSVRPHLRAGRCALLLKNHGAIATGADLEEAFDRLETIEHFARIVLTARLLGRVESLSPEDVGKLLGMSPTAGEPGRPWKCGACGSCSASGGAGAPAQHAVDEHRLVSLVTENVRRRLGA
ncbi:MAG: class II aldolase/adducin family protein [bacterium]